MASRPDLDTFRVSPSSGRMPTLRAPEVENNAGRQLQQLGGAISGAASSAEKIYLESLRESNALVVNDAVTKAEEARLALSYGDAGYTRQKGYDAVQRASGKSLTEEYGEEYGKALEGIAGGLHNDAQKAAFSRYQSQAQLKMRENLDRHTDSEFVNWAESNISGSVTLLQDSIRLGYDDPEATRDAMEAIKGHVAQLPSLKGTSATTVEALQRRYIGDAVSGAVSSMIEEGKWQSAEAYLNAHRGQMDADSVAKTSQLLDGEADYQIATQVAQDVFYGAVADNVASTPEDFISPVQGYRVSGNFGADRGTHKHAGVDMAGLPVGSPVSATASGAATVKRNPGGYGLYVEIDHGGGLVTRYGHLSAAERKVGETWTVRQGEAVGKLGGAKGDPNAGRSSGAHLHYEVRRDGKAVDPTGRYRTAGSTSGPRTPTQTKEEFRRRILDDPRLQGDQRRTQQALAEGDKLFGARDYDERKREEDTSDALWRAVANGQPIPASVRNSVDPKELMQAQRIQAEAITGPKADPMTSAIRTVDLEDKIVSGGITRVEQLYPFVNQLTPADFKSLGDRLQAVRKGDTTAIDSMKSTASALTAMDVEISAAGINTTKTKGEYTPEYAGLRSAAYREIESRERAAGRAIPVTEKRQIVNELITQTVVGTGMFGRQQRGFGFEAANQQNQSIGETYSGIPSRERVLIADALRAQGVPPNQITYRKIVEVYERRKAQAR